MDDRVSPEQGASTSSVVAANFLMSRLPGTAGEANDAVSACTKVHVSEARRLVRLPEKKVATSMDTTTTQSKTEKLD